MLHRVSPLYDRITIYPMEFYVFLFGLIFKFLSTTRISKNKQTGNGVYWNALYKNAAFLGIV